MGGLVRFHYMHPAAVIPDDEMNRRLGITDEDLAGYDEVISGLQANTLLTLFSGVILQILVRKNRQDFEMQLIQAHQQYQHLLRIDHPGI